MKKIGIKTGMITIFAAVFMFVSTSAFAAIECTNMRVVMAGSKVIGTEQVNVVRVTRGGTQTCGSMNVGEARTFNLAAASQDAQLAAALTALSLGQPVYMYLADNGAASNSTVWTLQVTAP